MISKEFLEGLGITDEAVVKSITDTYNADIKTEKDSTAAVQKQLDEANTAIKSYNGTSLTSGTTAISVSVGDILEIVNISSSKVKAVAYVTVTASDIAE